MALSSLLGCELQDINHNFCFGEVCMEEIAWRWLHRSMGLCLLLLGVDGCEHYPIYCNMLAEVMCLTVASSLIPMDLNGTTSRTDVMLQDSIFMIPDPRSVVQYLRFGLVPHGILLWRVDPMRTFGSIVGKGEELLAEWMNGYMNYWIIIIVLYKHV